MSSQMIIKITDQNSSQRLDKFLTKDGSINLSRQQIQKFIKQGAITVNGRTTKPHYLIKMGDSIIINNPLALWLKTTPAEHIDRPPLIRLAVIAETADYLVLNKPAGLAVHGSNNQEQTLADILAAQYPSIKKIGDDPERPGIVHRLDKEVSGLMVVAKTQAAFADLKKQFQQRKVIKQYIALVYGKISVPSGIINFPIKRSAKGFKMAALPITNKKQTNLAGRPAGQSPALAGRQALTEFAVVGNFINYTLLKIKIKTGRTHQIRVHLAAYGHPVVGDNIYSTAKTRIQNTKLGLNRIFLIADQLTFTDLANQKKNYKINLTQELKNVLNKIK